MPPDSIAMSVPEPIAIPTSAVLNAGASLIPSPTKATLPAFWKFFTRSALSRGRTSAITVSIPTCRAIALATTWLSPVSMTGCSPWVFNSAMAALEVGLGASWMAIKPITRLSSATTTTVFAAFCKSIIASCHCSSMARSSNNFSFPTRAVLPFNCAFTPLPSTAVKLVTVAGAMSAFCAALVIAVAKGCSEDCSRLAATRKTWSRSPTTSVTSGVPLVTVPVLSKIMVLTSFTFSRTSPFLIKIPILAPRPVPTINAVGVAKPRAHGHAITTTETAKINACASVAPRKTYHTKKVAIAKIKTTGTKISETRSVKFWIGAWLFWAFFTNSTICANMVSLPTLLALKTKVPVLLIVEPITWSPTFLVTGMLSPVTIDSSIVEEPDSITPSTAIFSPGRTRIWSPTATSLSGTLTYFPSRSTSASLACKLTSFSTASEALFRIFSSKTWPNKTKVVTNAALSKKTAWPVIIA